MAARPGFTVHHLRIVIPGTGNLVVTESADRRIGRPFEVVLGTGSESERIACGWQVRALGGVYIRNRRIGKQNRRGLR